MSLQDDQRLAYAVSGAVEGLVAMLRIKSEEMQVQWCCFVKYGTHTPYKGTCAKQEQSAKYGNDVGIPLQSRHSGHPLKHLEVRCPRIVG